MSRILHSRVKRVCVTHLHEYLILTVNFAFEKYYCSPWHRDENPEFSKTAFRPATQNRWRTAVENFAYLRVHFIRHRFARSARAGVRAVGVCTTRRKNTKKRARTHGFGFKGRSWDDDSARREPTVGGHPCHSQVVRKYTCDSGAAAERTRARAPADLRHAPSSSGSRLESDPRVRSSSRSRAVSFRFSVFIAVVFAGRSEGPTIIRELLYRGVSVVNKKKTREHVVPYANTWDALVDRELPDRTGPCRLSPSVKAVVGPKRWKNIGGIHVRKMNDSESERHL